MGDILYLPVMCCGQEMADIYADGKRVMAVCQVCGKEWIPQLKAKIGFTQSKIYLKTPISKEESEQIDLVGLQDFVAYVKAELTKDLQKEMNRFWDEAQRKILYGEDVEYKELGRKSGKSIFLGEMQSMRPMPIWIGVDYAKPQKPKNHYERMMSRRKTHV
jgi:hypothetical protein